MTTHVKIPVGRGTEFASASYFAGCVTAAATDGQLTVEFERPEGSTSHVTVEGMTAAFRADVKRGQPVTLEGVPREQAVGSVRLPIADGVSVTVRDQVFGAGELRVPTMRHAVQQDIYNHGASYEY